MPTITIKKRFYFGLIVFLLGLFSFVLYFMSSGFTLAESNTEYIESLCSGYDCLCWDWGKRYEDAYLTENNVWNKGEISDYQQCVYIESGSQGVDAGWAWNWPGLRFNVVAYPSIIYGKKPWFSTSTSPLLPSWIEELDCLQADFEVVQRGIGNGNLSFDLWVTGDETASSESIMREIMIWISHRGTRPAGKRVASLNLDGFDVELRWKENFSTVPGGPAWSFLQLYASQT